MLAQALLAVALIPVAVVASNEFNPLHHSGPVSPYFDAPSQDGIATDTPAGCTVDQAAYILRHGSRFPELGSFAGWQALYAKFQNSSYTAEGPLAFIPSWVPPVDDAPHEPLYLSSTGALEAFSLGVDLRKRYKFTKGGENITIWSAGQQRVLDTATYFTRGYLSQGNYLTAPSSNRGTIISLPDSVNYTFANSLTPSSGCPNYSSGDRGSATSTAYRATYQNTTAKRLNQYLDGLTLDATDIGVMQDLCGFQAEVDGDTRFCDVFEESEWLDYEYAHDLNYYYGSGPGNPYSATVGFPWVKAVSDLFALGPNQSTPGGNITPPALIMGFTHDNNLPPIISALGLWNTSAAHGRLSCAAPPAHKVTHVAGAAPQNLATQAYVRVRVDRAPVAIPGCAEGPGASCPLAAFTKYVDTARRAAAGDFVERCGLQGVANATGDATFFTVAPKDVQEVLVGLN
ncbi:phosphoglycerate mutase-like protein [Mycena sp. CBHHK59/15]|nr:phosphoglycerate mutase-like protein [Mycena sp. CBHHK59/15]